MKRRLRTIIALFLLISVTVISCKPDEDQEYKVAGGISVSSSGISILDDELTLNFSAANPAVNNITVSKTSGGPVIAEVPIQAGEGSLVLSKETLGLANIGDKSQLFFTTDLPSKSTTTTTITMVNPIAFEDVTIGQIDTTAFIPFSVNTNKEVNSVVVEIKTNKKGTYAPVAAPEDTIFLMGSDYNLTDTIFVKITASNTLGVISAENRYPIRMVPLDTTATGTLDTTSINAYNFEKHKIVPLAGDSADVKFIHSGLTYQGLEGVNAVFLKVSEEVYETGDAVAAEKTIQDAISSNTTIKVLTNLKVGDSFIFKTTRKGEPFYGLMQITELNTSRFPEQDFVTFQYKY